MTQGILTSLRTSNAGNRFPPLLRRGRFFACLALALSAGTVLSALPVHAQSNSNVLRGSTSQGVGSAPGVLVQTAGTASTSGQLAPGEVVQGQATAGPLAQQALTDVTPPSPFEELDEEEEAEARETPQSRVGPTQAFPEDEEEADDPFDEPLPDPAEPLTEEELERERLARLRRVRAVEPAEPLQSGPEVEEEEDPYAAVGIALGTFTLRPTIDLGIAATSRKAFRESGTAPVRVVPNDEEGVFGEIDLGVELRSNWVRHSLLVEANAKFQEGIKGDAEAEPEFDLAATGILNITPQTTLTSELDYSFLLEDASSANAEIGDLDAIAAAATPSQQTVGGLFTLGHDTGLLFGEVAAGATRTILGEVELGNGSSIVQSDNDNTLYTLGLRGGFRATPVFRPFVEGQVGWRLNDSVRDGAGFARDSQRYTLRLGTELDFGQKLTGEVAVGYVTEEFDDRRLGSLGGVSLAAEIEWLPRRGTQVGLTVETSTQPSGASGVSGAIAYVGEATVTQQIRRNLSTTFTAGLEFEDFNVIESDQLTATAGVGFTYWMNRGLGLVGNYSHDRVMSDDPAQKQSSNSVFLGLRLQR